MDVLRRAAIGAAVALALLMAEAIPASAASKDGASNTIEFSVASATLDKHATESSSRALWMVV